MSVRYARMVVLVLVASLAFAGAAEAKSVKVSKGEAAKEKGHERKADVAPPPAPAPDAPMRSRAPATSAAWPVLLDAAPPATPSTTAQPAEEPHATAAPVDATFAAPPQATAIALAPVAQADDPSGVWWALPLAGLGALGFVVLARRERALTLPTARDSVPGHLLAARKAIVRGDLEGALAWFDRALDLEPDLAVAHFCKGVCLADAGRLGDAYEALLAASAADPTDGATLLALARVAARMGRTKVAMDQLVPLVREAPELGETLYEDDELSALRDHPRFLALCGRL